MQVDWQGNSAARVREGDWQGNQGAPTNERDRSRGARAVPWPHAVRAATLSPPSLPLPPSLGRYQGRMRLGPPMSQRVTTLSCQANSSTLTSHTVANGRTCPPPPPNAERDMRVDAVTWRASRGRYDRYEDVMALDDVICRGTWWYRDMMCARGGAVMCAGCVPGRSRETRGPSR
jgi:hypothetical protein